MSIFTVKLTVDNASFRDENEDINCHEIAAILRKIANRMENIGCCSEEDLNVFEQVRDTNGNKVGYFEIS